MLDGLVYRGYIFSHQLIQIQAGRKRVTWGCGFGVTRRTYTLLNVEDCRWRGFGSKVSEKEQRCAEHRNAPKLSILDILTRLLSRECHR